MAKSSRAGWVFFSDRKKKYTRGYVYRIVTRIARITQIEKRVTPHKFRHRSCTRALNIEGTNIYSAMGYMGHYSIAVSEKYMHLAGLLSGSTGEALDQMPQGFTAKNFKKPTVYNSKDGLCMMK